MGGLFIGLASIVIPIFSLYTLQKKFPIANFINLPPDVQNVLFHPTWDAMVMFFIVAAVFLYAVSTGRGRVALIIVSSYIAYGIAAFVFFQQSLFGMAIPHASIPKITIFLILVLLVIFLMFKMSLGGAIRGSMSGIAWWNALVQSVMAAGLLSSFLYSFLSSAETALFSPITKLLVGRPEVQLVWIVLPFLWFWMIQVFKRE